MDEKGALSPSDVLCSRWAARRRGHGGIGRGSGFGVPLNGTHEYTFRDDGFRQVFLLNWSMKARQCVCFDILMAWIIRDGVMEASKE